MPFVSFCETPVLLSDAGFGFFEEFAFLGEEGGFEGPVEVGAGFLFVAGCAEDEAVVAGDGGRFEVLWGEGLHDFEGFRIFFLDVKGEGVGGREGRIGGGGLVNLTGHFVGLEFTGFEKQGRDSEVVFYWQVGRLALQFLVEELRQPDRGREIHSEREAN